MLPPSATTETREQRRPSLSESYRTVPVPLGKGRFWGKLGAFAGPGYMVAVGYMDPGNWATGLAGGSAFGYTLLSVILLSNLMAMVLQALCARLGIVTGLDLAEVLGTAIALQLLFGLPLVAGVCLTAFDVMLILALQRFGFRKLEAFIVALLVVIAGCFAFELIIAQPSIAAIAVGLVPSAQIVTNPAMLYIAIGILGATVMPHNLYLHSSIVQTRAYGLDEAGKRDALRHATIDSTIALFLALFINGSILILAAAAFHVNGRTDVADLSQAYRLLSPTLGAGAASVVFAVALLASGQNSTVTGTLAGQIVMEGFLDLRLPLWLRRMVTRLLAIVPAVIVVALRGDDGAMELLVLSQVVLSLQLPFAIVPLVRFTSDAKKMGTFASPLWLKIVAWAITAVVIALNVKLLVGFFFG